LAKIMAPMNVLEIGSMGYESSDTIARAMARHNNWGRIHSIDVRRGGYNGNFRKIPGSALVTPLFWLPHHTGDEAWKHEADIVHPEFKNMTNDQIFEKNCELLGFVAPANGYDMIFIDGDHSYEGISWDWRYACRFASEGALIVIDDLYDDRHMPVRRFWEGLHTKKWDFREWNDSHPNYFTSMGVTLTNDPLCGK